MKLVPFEMERWQSTWEHAVDFNLSESGVDPLPLREILCDDASIAQFLNHPSRILSETGRRNCGL